MKFRTVTLLEAKVLTKCSKSRGFVDLCRSSAEKENFSPNAIHLESHSLETPLYAGCCCDSIWYYDVSGELKFTNDFSSSYSLIVSYFLLSK